MTKGSWSRKDAACLLLADWLKEDIADGAPPAEPGVYGDVLTVALARVNWQQIAAHLLDSVPEDAKQKDDQ
jgi:hypothetical protein